MSSSWTTHFTQTLNEHFSLATRWMKVSLTQIHLKELCNNITGLFPTVSFLSLPLFSLQSEGRVCHLMLLRDDVRVRWKQWYAERDLLPAQLFSAGITKLLNELFTNTHKHTQTMTHALFLHLWCSYCSFLTEGTDSVIMTEKNILSFSNIPLTRWYPAAGWPLWEICEWTFWPARLSGSADFSPLQSCETQ